MAINTLIFDILAKDRASKTFKDVGKAAENTGKKFSGLQKAALAGGAAAGVFLAKFGRDSVKAFGEAEKSTTQLQDAFSRFPKLADSNIKAFQALNQELQKKTKFDDEAYASGQAVLAQFGLTGKQILAVTPLLGDYAAKTGRDVPTAAKLLGKASLGNARALKDLGINFKASGDQAKDMATVIQLVRERVGGFAAKEGKTATGRAAILSNQFQELQETVGSKLLPALLKVTDALLKMVDFVSRNSKVIVPLVVVFGTFVGTLFTAVKVIGLINAGLALMGVETTVATGGLTLIIPAIAALIAGLILAYKKSETFRNIVKGVFKVVANAGLTMIKILLTVIKMWVEAWLTAVGLIIKSAAAAFGWVPGIGGKLKKANRAFETFRRGVTGQFDKVIDKVDQMQRKINKTHGKTIKITAKMAMANRLKIAAQQGVALTITGKPIPLAAGGLVRGPGGPVGDKIPARLSDGEYVIKASRARQLGTRFLDTLNGAKSIGGDPAGMTVGFAAGGSVSRAQAYVRAQASDPYVWGGVGPNGFDCSGLTGAVYGLLRGMNPNRRYFTTASDFGALGFKPGTGAYTIGVNPYTHMAGNIGGLPFEAASTRSGIHVGRGAQSVMNFARQYYLAALGGVFGGMGSVNLTAGNLQKLYKAISFNWGVPSAGRTLSFEAGTPYVPRTGTYRLHRGEAVVPAAQNRSGPVDLSDRTINKLAQVLLAGIGASSVASARRADLYART